MKITDEMVAAAASAYYNSKVDHDIDLAFRLTIEAALAASPASAEPVKVKEIISNTIGFNFEPNELQTVNADDLLRLAAALTGKLEDAS